MVARDGVIKYQPHSTSDRFWHFFPILKSHSPKAKVTAIDLISQKEFTVNAYFFVSTILKILTDFSFGNGMCLVYVSTSKVHGDFGAL